MNVHALPPKVDLYLWSTGTLAELEKEWSKHHKKLDAVADGAEAYLQKNDQGHPMASHVLYHFELMQRRIDALEVTLSLFLHLAKRADKRVVDLLNKPPKYKNLSEAAAEAGKIVVLDPT